MMSLADMTHIIFKGSVSEHDAARLKPGMAVTMTVAPYPDDVVKATLSKVAIQSETLNSPDDELTSAFDNGFEVKANNLKMATPLNIRSGFSASAKVTLQEAKDVLVIPERALRFDHNTPMILIPDDSKRGYHLKKVTLGLSDGINVQILMGIKLGEKLVDNSLVNDGHE